MHVVGQRSDVVWLPCYAFCLLAGAGIDFVSRVLEGGHCWLSVFAVLFAASAVFVTKSLERLAARRSLLAGCGWHARHCLLPCCLIAWSHLVQQCGPIITLDY